MLHQIQNLPLHYQILILCLLSSLCGTMIKRVVFNIANVSDIFQELYSALSIGFVLFIILNQILNISNLAFYVFICLIGGIFSQQMWEVLKNILLESVKKSIKINVNVDKDRKNE